MNEDMSNLINKFSSMLKNNEIPPELSNIMKNISNNNSSTSSSNSSIGSSSKNVNNNNNSDNNSKKDVSSNSKISTDTSNTELNNINIGAIKKLFEQNSDSNNSQANNDDNNSTFNFDINTMLKMKSIVEAINSQKDDPRANLLKSLKPYLKESRKEKVDQYIKIFSIEKVFEQFSPIGGEKKHDV